MAAVSRGPAASGQARALEVFGAFLWLGVSSFGGPVAHLAYFRDELVVRRRWLGEEAYAELVALCQFLPGPASSQLGFAIGLHRAGWAGALAAFIGFTLPSALLMYAIAVHLPALADAAWGQTLVHGLKLVAVVVVAHGVWGMARVLTPDLRRAGIALLAAALALWLGGMPGQLAAIASGALLGPVLCRAAARSAIPGVPGSAVSRPVALLAATLFLAGLAWALWPGPADATLSGIAAAHYQAGALVFGGGHVVLPLLDAQLVGAGWLGPERFLAGYGAAQAMPGPMFTLASYLGASIDTGHRPALGSLVATLAVFLPGFLVLVAALPLWGVLKRDPRLAAAMAGVGAAVVGLLLCVLYRPLWTTAVADLRDVATVVVGLVLCGVLRRPVLAVLPWCIGMTWIWALF